MAGRWVIVEELGAVVEGHEISGGLCKIPITIVLFKTVLKNILKYFYDIRIILNMDYATIDSFLSIIVPLKRKRQMLSQ